MHVHLYILQTVVITFIQLIVNNIWNALHRIETVVVFTFTVFINIFKLFLMIIIKANCLLSARSTVCLGVKIGGAQAFTSDWNMRWNLLVTAGLHSTGLHKKTVVLQKMVIFIR